MPKDDKAKEMAVDTTEETEEKFEPIPTPTPLGGQPRNHGETPSPETVKDQKATDRALARSILQDVLNTVDVGLGQLPVNDVNFASRAAMTDTKQVLNFMRVQLAAKLRSIDKL